MLHQEIFIECAVVVIIVTASCRARVGWHSRMTFPLGSDTGVTVKAKIFWYRDAHGSRDLLAVFGMTRHARQRVKSHQEVGMARVSEPPFAVGIIGSLKFLGVALQTGVLSHAFERRAAGLTGQFDLVVAVGRCTGKKHPLILRGCQSFSEKTRQRQAANKPEPKKIALSCRR